MNKAFSISYHSDEIAEYLTCIQACFYYALKAETELSENIYDIFLRDITFYIVENFDGRIYDIDFEDASVNQDFFQHHYIIGGKGKETLKKVEELLDKGKCVLIQTIMQRVPFFYEFKGYDYIPNEEELQNNLHAFLVIGHDEKNLYFAERPHVINKENFVPHPDNKTIGIIEKSTMMHSFNEMLNYTYLDINESGMQNTFYIVKNKLEDAAKNYAKKQDVLDNRRIFPGEEGLKWLSDYIGSGKLNLEESSIRYPNSTVHNFLNWKLSFIAFRRIHLARSLGINHHMFDCDITELAESIRNCGIRWKIITANITKKNARKDYSIDAGLIESFHAAFAAEREMIEKIRACLCCKG